MGFSKGKMMPNKTAPAKARSKTAGPNGSFPIGDKKHAELAVRAAPRSEKAGHISPSEEKAIVRKADAELGKKPKRATPAKATAYSYRAKK